MANARGKSIDKTHLSIDMAEERGIVHRDYLAHCHRWSHVVKHLYRTNTYRTARILDVGCGREMPLAKLLYSNKLIPAKYYGVDVNKLELPEMLNREKLTDVIELFSETDVCDIQLTETGFHMGISIEPCSLNYIYKRPNLVTCFEVLEHVEPEHSVRMLKKIFELMTDDGVAFVSTPCYNGKAAANHVNEMRFEVLGKVITDCGFNIEGVFGTFASQKDIEPCLQYATFCCNDGSNFVYSVYNELKQYYDSNVLATLFAPLFPDKARNAIWVLTKEKQELYDRAISTAPSWNTEFKEKSWEQTQEQFTYEDGELIPWSSSDHWKDLNPQFWEGK